MPNFEIVHQDQDLLVIDKAPGITVFPENEDQTEETLIDQLITAFPYLKEAGMPPRYGIAHRLDKDTSGLLLVAKNSQFLEVLQKQFEDRQTIKKYLTLLQGKVTTKEGQINSLIGRCPSNRTKQCAFSPIGPDATKKGLRPAITDWKVVEIYDDFTLVEAYPKTGRKHQLRVHFSSIGHPIVGDQVYGFKDSKTIPGLSRQFLHAAYLKIKMANGQEKEFNSPLPPDLQNIILNLEK